MTVGYALFGPAPDPPRQRADSILGQAQRLADLASRAFDAGTLHDRRQYRVLTSIRLADPLDHLLAALVLKVDVDVGRLRPVLRQEAPEQQLADDRVDAGDAQHEAEMVIGLHESLYLPATWE